MSSLMFFKDKIYEKLKKINVPLYQSKTILAILGAKKILKHFSFQIFFLAIILSRKSKIAENFLKNIHF